MDLAAEAREDYACRFAALEAALDDVEGACRGPVDPQRLGAGAGKLAAVLHRVDLPEPERPEG